jgi:hypothetical protein
MTISRPPVARLHASATATDQTGDYSGVDRRRGPKRSGKERRQQDLGPPGGPAAERRVGVDRRQSQRRRA